MPHRSLVPSFRAGTVDATEYSEDFDLYPVSLSTAEPQEGQNQYPQRDMSTWGVLGIFRNRQLVSTGWTWCRPAIITDTTITDHLAGVYVHSATKDNTVWYDDVALSTGYIGSVE